MPANVPLWIPVIVGIVGACTTAFCAWMWMEWRKTAFAILDNMKDVSSCLNRVLDKADE